MAVARDLKAARGIKDDRHVIAVIGDGAMSAGMAYRGDEQRGRIEVAADRGVERQ
jgi:deoxyxylulose-5-phosphate synthase